MKRISLLVLLILLLSTFSVAQDGKKPDAKKKEFDGTLKYFSNPAAGKINEIVVVIPGESASAWEACQTMSKYYGKGGRKNKNAFLAVINTNPDFRKSQKFKQSESFRMKDKDEEDVDWHVCVNGTIGEIRFIYNCPGVPAHYISLYDGVLDMFHCILCNNKGPQKMTVIAPTMLDDRFDERIAQIKEKVKVPELLHVFVTSKSRKAVKYAENAFQGWFADAEILSADAKALECSELIKLVMKTKITKKPKKTPKMQILTPEVEMKIWHEKSGKFVSYKEMVLMLVVNDVVFFGEKHDSSASHSLEIGLFSTLYSQNPNFALSLEMFERDVQEVLDDYLSGKISEQDLFAKARPWPNYLKDYRPMVNFAKIKGLSVIAANVPRKYAGIVARGGVEALDNLPADERKHIAKKINTDEGDYKNRFFDVMKQMMGSGGHKMNLDRMYAAQCVKDDTMAESIYLYMQKNKGMKVYHVDGSFHSDYRLGTVERLLLRDKGLKIGILSAIPVKDFDSIETDKVKGLADFVVFVKEKSHKEDF
ncbi:MAG: ChaN family lipoprotein [Planctomycetes bacterium]|nr:ChaN family lipoprotein [Planctomycetota bacterium]